MWNILGSAVGSCLVLLPLGWVFIGAMVFLEPNVIRSVHTRGKLNTQPSPWCLSMSHQDCHISEADHTKEHTNQYLEWLIYTCFMDVTKRSFFKGASFASSVEENKGCRKLSQNILCCLVGGWRVLTVASVADSWLHAHKPACTALFCVPAASLKLHSHVPPWSPSGSLRATPVYRNLEVLVHIQNTSYI